MSKCPKGKPCGKTCISRNKKCLVDLKAPVDKLIKVIEESKNKYDPERYKDWNVEAEGFYGIVSFSPDGSRAVKLLVERNDGKGGFGPHEVEVGKEMAKLGHSPQIYSHSDKHLEMERIPGKPLWADYQRQEGEEPMNARQATAAAAAIRDLHKLGFYHGDMHNKQFVIDGDNLKLIDFGLSRPASTDPRKVIQDLNKISALVNWNNPALDDNPYVVLIRRYREMYKNPPSRKKKEREEYERSVAEQYLLELGSL